MLSLELHRHKDTVRCTKLGAELPWRRQEQLTKTFTASLLKYTCFHLSKIWYPVNHRHPSPTHLDLWMYDRGVKRVMSWSNLWTYPDGNFDGTAVTTPSAAPVVTHTGLGNVDTWSQLTSFSHFDFYLPVCKFTEIGSNIRQCLGLSHSIKSHWVLSVGGFFAHNQTLFTPRTTSNSLHLCVHFTTITDYSLLFVDLCGCNEGFRVHARAVL